MLLFPGPLWASIFVSPNRCYAHWHFTLSLIFLIIFPPLVFFAIRESEGSTSDESELVSQLEQNNFFVLDESEMGSGEKLGGDTYSDHDAMKTPCQSRGFRPPSHPGHAFLSTVVDTILPSRFIIAILLPSFRSSLLGHQMF